MMALLKIIQIQRKFFLYKYMFTKRLNIPLTIVGMLTELHSSVKIYFTLGMTAMLMTKQTISIGLNNTETRG